MQVSSAIPSYVFSQSSLHDVGQAAASLRDLLDIIRTSKQVMIDLSRVESITDEFADQFFGSAAAECVVHKSSMDFKFGQGRSSELISTIKASIKRSLPPGLGGSATVH